jgi:hypothetical protein
LWKDKSAKKTDASRFNGTDTFEAIAEDLSGIAVIFLENIDAPHLTYSHSPAGRLRGPSGDLLIIRL